jgi:hypothetical protein
MGARVRAALALGAVGVLGAGLAPAAAAPSIAQRVLRAADVPGSQLLTPAPKPMMLANYVRQTEIRASSRSRATATLRAAGFRLGALVSLSGPGQRASQSTAIQLGSAAQAASVLTYQLRWVSSLDPNATTSVLPLASFPQGRLIRIVSRRSSTRGWGVVFTRGASVYTVVTAAKPDVSQATAIALARKVLARAGS